LTRLPAVSGRAVAKALERIGYVLDRQRGEAGLSVEEFVALL
jgi:predicted RNA binding protein YcfA (HicA-like mRNA interferase family)